jgi:hypothetical protein
LPEDFAGDLAFNFGSIYLGVFSIFSLDFYSLGVFYFFGFTSFLVADFLDT